MKENLLIIGASGHGKVVADVASQMNKWRNIAFLDDNENLKKSMGYKVLGSSKEVHAYIDEYDVFIGIGDNELRERFYKKIQGLGSSIPTLVHPSATISDHVEIGEGTIVMPGSVINCNTRIGKACIINTSATIDHDNEIEDFVHVSPGVNLAGTVEVGKSTWLGIGSIVSNNIKITNNCIIGAGAVVTEDINKSGTYIGVPIRRVIE